MVGYAHPDFFLISLESEAHSLVHASHDLRRPVVSYASLFDLQNNMVASGGLGREVFIWDLEAAMVPLIRANNEATEEGSFEAGYASGVFSELLLYENVFRKQLVAFIALFFS